MHSIHFHFAEQHDFFHHEGEWYKVPNSEEDLPVVANRISCTGNERQLVECQGRYGEHLVNNACSHGEDVGLRSV